MHKIGPIQTYFMFFIPSVVGAIVFSQGVSFAWSHSDPPTSFTMNLHAGLLAASGLALMTLSTMLHYVLKRLIALEEKVAEQK